MFSFVWRCVARVCVWYVLFLGANISGAKSRISLGAIYEFLCWGVGSLPMSLRDGRQDTDCVAKCEYD